MHSKSTNTFLDSIDTETRTRDSNSQASRKKQFSAADSDGEGGGVRGRESNSDEVKEHGARKQSIIYECTFEKIPSKQFLQKSKTCGKIEV